MLRVTGTYSNPHQDTVTVGTTSTPVLPANFDRMYLLLVNGGTETVYVMLGAPAELGKGIPILSGMGNYEMSTINGNIYQGAINAICASGALPLMYSEGW